MVPGTPRTAHYPMGVGTSSQRPWRAGTRGTAPGGIQHNDGPKSGSP